jgi:hypothetical protein
MYRLGSGVIKIVWTYQQIYCALWPCFCFLHPPSFYIARNIYGVPQSATYEVCDHSKTNWSWDVPTALYITYSLHGTSLTGWIHSRFSACWRQNCDVWNYAILTTSFKPQNIKKANEPTAVLQNSLLLRSIKKQMPSLLQFTYFTRKHSLTITSAVHSRATVCHP